MDRAISILEARVRETLVEGRLTGGKRLVVAVSGGPDSLSMLFALCRLREPLGLELHGAHLDHRLRGESSESDARFATETFRRLGVPHTTERADVASFRRLHRLSTEEAAREVRYRFLARVAEEQGADAVAVGHTADDQAETILMHIIRSSGLGGLRGMEALAWRSFGGRRVLLVRPLLKAAREETRAYCRALSLEPRHDESNLSTAPTRNRVRLELLPALEQYNPSVREALVRLSTNAAADMAYLEGQVSALWGEVVRAGEGYVAVKKAAFRRLAPALRPYLLRRAVAELKGDAAGLEQTHLDDMARLVAGPAGRSLHLPGGLRLTVGYEEAALAPHEGDPLSLPPLDGEHSLLVPGEASIDGWRITASVTERSPGSSGVPISASRRSNPLDGEPTPESDRTLEDAPGGLTAVLSYRAVGGRLVVRARRPGDRFQPLGMSRQKKLKDFMVDARVPRQWRDGVPLVVSPRGIAWVVGWRIADWAAGREGERSTLEMTFAAEGRGRG